MVKRLIVATTALLLGAGLAQGRDAAAPKPQPNPAASTTDPMDVPRDMRNWFAKSVDDMLGDEGPDADQKPPRGR